MKIKKAQPEARKECFGNLLAGDVFSFDEAMDYIYMKLSFYDGMDILYVNLSNGLIGRTGTGVLVFPVVATCYVSTEV